MRNEVAMLRKKQGMASLQGVEQWHERRVSDMYTVEKERWELWVLAAHRRWRRGSSEVVLLFPCEVQ